MDGGQIENINSIYKSIPSRSHSPTLTSTFSFPNSNFISSVLECKGLFLLHLATFRLNHMINSKNNYHFDNVNTNINNKENDKIEGLAKDKKMTIPKMENNAFLFLNISKCKLCMNKGYKTNLIDGSFEPCPVCNVDSSSPLLHQRYLLYKQVGRGAFSIVHLARDIYQVNKSEEEIVALKIFHKDYKAMAQSEISFMDKLKSVDKWNQYRTLKYKKSFVIDDHVCIVMNRLYPIVTESKGFSLEPFIPFSLSPSSAIFLSSSSSFSLDHHKKFLLDLTLQIYVFHEILETIHGDIKIENILKTCPIPNLERYQIIDYGNSVNIRDIESYYKSFEIHSLRYQAPEILVGMPPLGYEIDIWALGILLIEQWLGYHPFQKSYSKEQVLMEICALIGPLPRYLQKGIFCSKETMSRDYKFSIPSPPLSFSLPQKMQIEWQGEENCHSKHYESNSDTLYYYRMERTKRLNRLLQCKDWKLLDLIVDMIEPDPRARINVNGIITHPSLRHLLPFVQ